MNMRRRSNRGAAPQARNEASYDQAIETLKSMFAHVDESVLKLVLESNQGRMETTVEHLLAMAGGSAAANESGPPGPAPNPGPAAPSGPPKYVPPNAPASGSAAATNVPS